MDDLEGFLAKRMRADRLKDVLTSMGKEAPQTRNKESLAAALAKVAEGAPRQFVRSLFRAELVALAQKLGANPLGRRNDDYVDAILGAWDGPPTENVPTTAARPSWQSDPARRDLATPTVDRSGGLAWLRMVPTRPSDQDQVSLFDFYRKLRNPELRRCTFVSYNCNAGFLQRLLEAGAEALIESAIDLSERSDASQPAVTVVLDAEHHGLAEGRAGRTLVAMARQGIIDLRLGPSERRMHAKIYAFQSVHIDDLEDEPIQRLEALLGSSNLTPSGFGTIPSANIEANVWFSADSWWGDDPAWQLAQGLLEWLDELVDLSRLLMKEDLLRLPTEEHVERRIVCKREVDTHREAVLKVLAEQLAARGRTAWSLYDPMAIPQLPDHQLVPVVRSMNPRTEGFLLFDEVGLGKTIETGLILSRERRRIRDTVENVGTDSKEVLLVAPPALHEQWASELSQKFGIEAEVFGAGHRRRRENELRGRDEDIKDGEYWRRTPSQVIITSPELVRNESHFFPTFDIVVVDECHRAQGEQTFEAIEDVALNARLRIFASGTPIQNELADLWVPAAMVFPEAIAEYEADFDAQFGALAEADVDLLHHLIAPVTARSYRQVLIDAGQIKPRLLFDLAYELAGEELAAYRGIRELREEYRARRGHPSSWAFITLEQTFLSSPFAFVSVASRILGDVPLVQDPELDHEVRADDTSYEFLRRGPARKRLSALRETVRHYASSSAYPSRKEDALIRLLRDPALQGQRVLIFTRFRATQARLVRLLRSIAFPGDVRTINGGSSRSERRQTFAWFTKETTAKRPSGWAAGVLICTDVAAEGLNLQAACSALVNYDLPWNPQRIEQRIGRLQRWGQKENVRVFNFAATASGMKTMDQRVLEICREKFRMAREVLGASEGLFEAGEESLVKLVNEEETDELPPESTLGDREQRSIERVLSQPHETAAVAKHARFLDDRYRSTVSTFLARATLGQEEGTSAEGYLVDSVRAALLRGHVAVLQRASTGTRPVSGHSWGVGFRTVIEVRKDGANRDDEALNRWLLEEETPYFWMHTHGQSLVEGTTALCSEGFFERLPSEAEPFVGRAVIDYLREKRTLLSEAQADGAPLGVWREGAPNEIIMVLATIEQAAQALVKARVQQLQQEWDGARANTASRVQQSLSRLEALKKKSSTMMRAALQDVQQERYVFRDDIVVTQLLLILW